MLPPVNRSQDRQNPHSLHLLSKASAVSEKLARQLLLFNRSIPIEETIAKIEEVGVEDVRAAAETIFASKPTYALVGNVDGHYRDDEICRLLKA